MKVFHVWEGGVQQVQLDWTIIGAGTLYRDGDLRLTFTDFLYSFVDNIGKKGGGTYIYQVCGGGECTNTATASF